MRLIKNYVNPLLPSVAILYPFNTLEYHRFSDVFRRYKNATLGSHELKFIFSFIFSLLISSFHFIFFYWIHYFYHTCNHSSEVAYYLLGHDMPNHLYPQFYCIQARIFVALGFTILCLDCPTLLEVLISSCYFTSSH